jgi:hypothetical protein
LKVHKQCPLIFLVEVLLREVKSLGNEEGRGVGFGLCYELKREVEQGPYCV